MSALPRPDDTELHEFFAPYRDLVPDGNIVEILRDQIGDSVEVLRGVPPEKETFRYATGKWSLREVVGHLIDAERLYSFRALTVAREDGARLPGMDNEAWSRRSNAHERPLEELLDEWMALRQANVWMFSSFDAETGARTGLAGGRELTVRSFPWIIAGHELWHRRLIVANYLGGTTGRD